MRKGINLNHRNFYKKQNDKPDIKEEKNVVIEKQSTNKEEIIEETFDLTEQLYDMNKKEQVKKLEEFGLSNKEIKELRYEEDRVNKLFKLMNK